MNCEEIKELIRIGSQMSKLCFSLSQKESTALSTREREIMRQLQVEWDAEVRYLLRLQQTSG